MAHIKEGWFDATVGNSITGKYISMSTVTDKVKNFSYNIYKVEGSNGFLHLLRGTAMLTKLMLTVNIGDKIRITYKGKALGKTHPYHYYCVEKLVEEWQDVCPQKKSVTFEHDLVQEIDEDTKSMEVDL